MWRIAFKLLVCFLFGCCCRFVWDEAKYPTMSPLKEIVDAIHVQVSRIEDDLKVFCFGLWIYKLRILFPPIYSCFL